MRINEILANYTTVHLERLLSDNWFLLERNCFLVVGCQRLNLYHVIIGDLLDHLKVRWKECIIYVGVIACFYSMQTSSMFDYLHSELYFDSATTTDFEDWTSIQIRRCCQPS
jgi:hypothetical protein